MIVKTQKNISVSQLKPAAHNPPKREDPNRLAALRKSLQKDGQLLPLLITKDNTIVDGHRRWVAAKQMGLDTLFCLVIEGDADTIYAAVNSTAMKMSGNDALGVWLRNPKAVTGNMATRLAKVEAVLGRKLMEQMYAKGMSSNAYNLAVRVCRLSFKDDDDTVRSIVTWLVKFNMVNRVFSLLKDGGSPDVVLKAVKADRPIKMRATVDEEQADGNGRGK